ncbi:hypothetical protein D7030_08550 [Flavobacteriaceae bacterium AU392]|nr:hypothetical protein D1817_14555 [Flavobacteriaceae bacterium]RKM84072.1 hypothetical protein D7030_08550 [Flavobacteriaceae bacterium AU392]
MPEENNFNEELNINNDKVDRSIEDTIIDKANTLKTEIKEVAVNTKEKARELAEEAKETIMETSNKTKSFIQRLFGK